MGDFFEHILDQVAPYRTPDHDTYLDVLMGMYDEFDSYVHAYGEEDVWGPLMDVTRCPANGLAYLGQFVGERLRQGLPEEMAREQVADHAHMRRGTLESIARAAQRRLTGNRTVQIRERSGPDGDPHPEDYISVVTYEQETPDAGAVLQDIYSVLPADLALTYQALAGQTWGDVHDTTTTMTWGDVAAKWNTWGDVAGAQPGYSIWDRPRPIP